MIHDLERECMRSMMDVLQWYCVGSLLRRLLRSEHENLSGKGDLFQTYCDTNVLNLRSRVCGDRCHRKCTYARRRTSTNLRGPMSGGVGGSGPGRAGTKPTQTKTAIHVARTSFSGLCTTQASFRCSFGELVHIASEPVQPESI